MLFFNVRRTVLSTGRFLPLTYIGQYLRTSLVGTRWGGSAPGIAWAEARGAAERCCTQDTPSPSRPTLCSHADCSPPGSSVHGIFPGKDAAVGCHFLLQGAFPHLLHLLPWQACSLPPCHLGSPHQE